MQTLIRPLLSKTLRYGVKPLLNPKVPVFVQRAWVQGFSGINRQPDDISRCKIRSDAGRSIEVTQPAAWNGNLVLYFHGGAYCIGSAETHRSISGYLAHYSQAAVWLPDYRLAPESAYPAALEDALDAYRTLLRRGFEPGRVILAGDSAGGGLALRLALALKQAELPAPAALVLLSPWLDMFPVQQDCLPDKADPILSHAWIRHCASLVAPGPQERAQLTALWEEPLEDLPPTLIHVAREEILQPDAAKLAERLAEAGVPHQLSEFGKLWHVFHLHAGVLASADEALQGVAAFIHRAQQGHFHRGAGSRIPKKDPAPVPA